MQWQIDEDDHIFDEIFKTLAEGIFWGHILNVSHNPWLQPMNKSARTKSGNFLKVHENLEGLTDSINLRWLLTWVISKQPLQCEIYCTEKEQQHQLDILGVCFQGFFLTGKEMFYFCSLPATGVT